MGEFNLPKTTNRIMFDHFYDQASEVVEKIEKLKQELPQEVLKKIDKSVEDSIINARKEMIDMSNNHRDMLNKLHSETIDSIKHELNNNTISLANHVNNSLLYLGSFGICCGMIGGLIFWMAKSFIG